MNTSGEASARRLRPVGAAALARALAVAGLAAAALPGAAAAHSESTASAARVASEGPAAAAAPASCEGDGDPFSPDKVITGEFGERREGSYVFLPYKVPKGTTALRVRYCYEEVPSPANEADDHTLDLGLYEPRDDPSRPWGTEEFRGWGGSSHPDVILSPEGFTSRAQYAADPENQVPGRTTRAFLPGPIRPGKWAVELGLASIASQPADSDGRVAWRVEIRFRKNPAFADDPYKPARYDSSPARSRPGWYAGDLHVHGEHSALGDAPLEEVFDYAFGSLAEGKAGLDFVTLSDYVSGSSWGEVGRHQDEYPRRLIVRSAEVITYRGHANSHANTSRIDYRRGPLYERKPGGRLERLRGARPASGIFERINSVGGFTQINHPTIFPSPPFPPNLCRGCPWEYSPAQTHYSKVDGIEIATGPASLKTPSEPGPNPFTVTAIEFWEDALDAGHKIAAVGSSDSHNAGRTPNPITQAPIGTATTMVYADELSERGIRDGVEAGHTYVKVTGNDGPDLRFTARRRGAPGPPKIMGDTVRGRRVDFHARVLGAGPSLALSGPAYQLLVFKDGEPFRAVPVTDDDFSFRFRSAGLGRYRLQLQRGQNIETVSSPIYVEAAAEPNGGRGGDPPSGSGDRDGSSNQAGGGTAGDRSTGPRADPATDDAGGAGRTVAAGSAAGHTGSVGRGDLPFTGLSLAALILAGLGLLATGLAIPRRAGGRH